MTCCVITSSRQQNEDWWCYLRLFGKSSTGETHTCLPNTHEQFPGTPSTITHPTHRLSRCPWFVCCVVVCDLCSTPPQATHNVPAWLGVRAEGMGAFPDGCRAGSMRPRYRTGHPGVSLAGISSNRVIRCVVATMSCPPLRTARSRVGEPGLARISAPRGYRGRTAWAAGPAALSTSRHYSGAPPRVHAGRKYTHTREHATPSTIHPCTAAAPERTPASRTAEKSSQRELAPQRATRARACFHSKLQQIQNGRFHYQKLPKNRIFLVRVVLIEPLASH